MMQGLKCLRLIRNSHQLLFRHSYSQVKVLYDGECPLCMSEIKFLMWKDKQKNNISFVDISKPGYDGDEYSGITYDKAMEEMHVIGKDGKIQTGVPAMQEMYAAVGLAWVWGFYNKPIFTKVSDKAYNWFARNRLWLTRRDCTTGQCAIKKEKGSTEIDDKNNAAKR